MTGWCNATLGRDKHKNPNPRGLSERAALPQCGREVQEMAARRVESTLGVRFVYYCTGCRKVLGVSHRKGFWMG